MGLFSSSKRSTTNEDNRIINDMSGSTFDNSVDSSQTYSYEDSSYQDSSSTDNSYTDNSMIFEDNSYNDSSIDGDFNGNTGTVNVLDGGAISEAFTLGKHALTTASDTMRDASLLSARSIEATEFAMTQNTILSGNAMGVMAKTAESSMLYSQMNSAIVKDTATTALEKMSENVFQMKEQAASTVASATSANQKALETTTKLMTTMNQNGNDLLIDGVVNIAKYMGLGIGTLGLVFGLARIARSKG
jgi:hypothetical protein